MTGGVKDSPLPLDLKAFCLDNLQAAFLKLSRGYPWRDDPDSNSNFSHFLDRLHVSQDQFPSSIPGLVLEPLVNLTGTLVRNPRNNELVFV